ncbi:erythromycin esterase family protein [Amycolatopsis endophytica]
MESGFVEGAMVDGWVKGDDTHPVATVLADTVRFLAEREKRIVVAAHNGHVQRWPLSLTDPPATTLGVFLAATRGADYRVIGTTSGRGRTLSMAFHAGPMSTDLDPAPDARSTAPDTGNPGPGRDVGGAGRSAGQAAGRRSRRLSVALSDQHGGTRTPTRREVTLEHDVVPGREHLRRHQPRSASRARPRRGRRDP